MRRVLIANSCGIVLIEIEEQKLETKKYMLMPFITPMLPYLIPLLLIIGLFVIAFVVATIKMKFQLITTGRSGNPFDAFDKVFGGLDLFWMLIIPILISLLHFRFYFVYQSVQSNYGSDIAQFLLSIRPWVLLIIFAIFLLCLLGPKYFFFFGLSVLVVVNHQIIYYFLLSLINQGSWSVLGLIGVAILWFLVTLFND